MYSYIKGTLEEIRDDVVVVENNGIGYNIRIPMRVMETLPEKGSEVKIYTYLYVREDAFSLFGFSSYDELDMFKLLLNVSGIGPKGALAILSVMSANEVRYAIVSEDIKTISKAPGVGAKTAKRMVIELKDKINLEDVVENTLDSSVAIVSGQANKSVIEAEEALLALGYSAKEASSVLGGLEITEDMDVETILKLALKNMAFM